MIIVLGSVLIRQGAIGEATKLSLEHVYRSRTEPGCISHSVQHDCENSQRLVFVEEWSDLAALHVHFQVPESRAFVGALTVLATEKPKMAIHQVQQAGP
jgi:quinol monooxygenase YgiN